MNRSVRVFPGTTAQAGASAVHGCEFWLLLASSSMTAHSEFEYNSDSLDTLVPCLLRNTEELCLLYCLIQTGPRPQRSTFGPHRTIWMQSRIFLYLVFCSRLSNCNGFKQLRQQT